MKRPPSNEPHTKMTYRELMRIKMGWRIQTRYGYNIGPPTTEQRLKAIRLLWTQYRIRTRL